MVVWRDVPKRCVPVRNFWDPWSPRWIVPKHTSSLHSYIPVIFHRPIHIPYWIMAGLYQCRDIVSLGTINLGTRGPRTFVRGHIVWGRSVTPPLKYCQTKPKCLEMFFYMRRSSGMTRAFLFWCVARGLIKWYAFRNTILLQVFVLHRFHFISLHKCSWIIYNYINPISFWTWFIFTNQVSFIVFSVI